VGKGSLRLLPEVAFQPLSLFIGIVRVFVVDRDRAAA
jgi:hypothetical protein